MPTVIVSDTSPLISLARVGRLDILHRLFSELIVPDAVWKEIVEQGTGEPGSDEVRNATWIRYQTVKNRPLIRVLQQTLGAGEAEAIALALELAAEYVLIDDRMGRAMARRLDLPIIGLVGVLINAKHSGVLELVKPTLDALHKQAGFRISESLYDRVLLDEGEL